MTDTIVVGYNELPFFKKGWHERYVNPINGIFLRQTTKSASFLIFKQNHKEIALLISGSPSLLGGRQTAILKVNNKSIGEIIIESDEWIVKKYVISHLSDGELECTIEVNECFIPNEHLKNGDCRELGISVAAIRLA